MHKLVKLSFCLILVTLLFPTLTKTTYAQKSLDGEETTKSNEKKVEKKPSGKGLDDSGSSGKPSNNTNKSSGGKSLDDLGKSAPTKVDTHVETKKTDTFIRIGPGTTEKVTPPPPPHNKTQRVERSAEPRSVQQEDKDPGSEYPEMVTIPSGTFMMGSQDGQDNESPMHEVSVSSFEISKYEVTNYQFRIFVKATGYKTSAEEEGIAQNWKSYAIAGRAKYPVVYISYKDAMAYCKWLSDSTKQTYRLPTEAEWEYAARGGTKDQPYPWGKDIEAAKANYAYDESRKAYAEPILDFLKPVGSYEPNTFGLYDVVGNVAEWCFDGYKADYYKDSPKKDPVCSEQISTKVVRGGGWMNSDRSCSITFRKSQPGIYKSSSLGFRIVRVSQQSDPVAKSDPSNNQSSGK